MKKPSLQIHHFAPPFLLLALALVLPPLVLPNCAAAQQPPSGQSDPTLRAVICPIVYPSDETPGNKGVRYTFFGNAFFINSQGYILVDRPNSPPQLLKANIIATDWTHDVAILRATPNPFDGKFRVAFLPLAAKRSSIGDFVIASALHPSNIRAASTYKLPVQDWSYAQVLGFVQTHEEENLPETDLFVFNHEVQKGQSGSAVILATTHEIVGLVDGRWLRPSSFSLPSSNGARPVPYGGPLGAAVPIDYLLALLQKNSVSWSTAPAANLPSPTPQSESPK
jgi:hypothetical protein